MKLNNINREKNSDEAIKIWIRLIFYGLIMPFSIFFEGDIEFFRRWRFILYSISIFTTSIFLYFAMGNIVIAILYEIGGVSAFFSTPDIRGKYSKFFDYRPIKFSYFFIPVIYYSFYIFYVFFVYHKEIIFDNFLFIATALLMFVVLIASVVLMADNYRRFKKWSEHA